VIRLVLLLALYSVSVAQYVSNDIYAIAVFQNHSRQSEDQWLSEALPDMLTTDLTASKKVRVVSRQDLKKVITEQKLSLSGLIQESQQLELGQLLGATHLIIGSYSVMGNQVRIDTKVVSTRSGEVAFSVETTGLKSNVFSLEKMLALKILRRLGAFVSDEDKVALFQLESSNLEAVKSNYLGVIALDSKNVRVAKQHFEKAAKTDPYYSQAGRNMEKVTSMHVSGNNLVSIMSVETDKKKNQQAALKDAVETFTNDYWRLELKGQPSTESNRSNPNAVDLIVPVSVSIDKIAVRNYINSLKTLSDGEVEFKYIAKDLFYNDPEIQLYEENWAWLKKLGNYPSPYEYDLQYWFKSGKKIVLYHNNDIIAIQSFEVYLNTKYYNKIHYKSIPINLLNPYMFNRYRKKQSIPFVMPVTFKGISLSQVNSITRIEIE